MNPSFKKHLITHGLVVLAFLVITVIVHYPTFLSGKKISQHDIQQGFGGSKKLEHYRAELGEEPLWNNNMFSGMPSYLTGTLYSGDLLKYVYIAYGLGLKHPSSILFISFVSFYVLLLCFKVRPLLAFAGAVAFGLNGFNTIGVMAGHNAKVAAVALMPLVLAGIHLTFSGKKWLGVTLTALALGLEIRTGHPQITYYLLLIVMAYGINQLITVIKNKEFKDFGMNAGLLVIAAFLAVGANLGRLSTTVEYSKYSIRGKSELSAAQSASSGLDREYAFRYSNGITEPLFLFVPNIFGGSSQQELSTKSEVANALRNGGYNRTQIAQQVKAVPTYWGDQPLTAPYYAGTITVILFILGIVLLPTKQKAWLIVLALLGIVMSWGKNFGSFNYFLFDFLPGYNKFRSVTFTIIITMVAMNLLGFMALEQLLSREWNKKLQKKFFIALGIAGGFLILLLISSGALSYRGAIDGQLPDWFVNALREDRQSLLTRDTLRALFFTALFGALIWLNRQGKLTLNTTLFALALVVLVDSFSLSRRFIKPSNFAKDPLEDFLKPTEADNVILSAIKPGERVLNLQNPFNDNRTSAHHESIGGYHGAKIRRYQDLIDRCIGNEVQEAIQSLQSQSLNFGSLQVLNMLNTRYMYAGNQQNGVFPNNYTNGNAWVVPEVIPVNSPDEEINQICDLDTKNQAVIDQTKFDIPSVSGTGNISLVNRTPNQITYSANITGGNGLGVFSEVFYPKGWTASIDGNQAEIVRANYILRALEIPEGNHEITFTFSPTSYTLGNTIMMICSSLIILLFVVGLVLDYRHNANLGSEKNQ